MKTTILTFIFSCIVASLGLYANNALHFDGANDYVILDNWDDFNFNTNSFTLECWVNTTDQNYGGFISKRKLGAGNPQYGLNLQGIGGPPGLNGHAEFYIADGSASIWLFSDDVINDGTWHHIAVVRDGSSVTMYVDGVVQTNPSNVFTSGTLTDQPLTPYSEPVVLGRYWPTLDGNSLVGSMDEVSIWNTARTQQQIMGDLNRELSGSEAGLIAYYDFNQGIAGGPNPLELTLNDRSTNGNNGTLSNFALDGSTSNFIGGAPVISIPTMSQWALMILGLILTSLAVVRIRKVALA